MKTALTIAGSDSSGGAGIQADIKTMTANGVFAMSAITALTAQNTTGVTDIFETTPRFLAEQLDAIFTDIYPDAVKIGMVSSAELIDTIANSAHISRHLHLPVQSGSNSILAQMNRKYTVEDYLSLIAYAKRRMPEMTYSSDIIVGFPGETEEDFCATEALIREVEYMQLFTFIYSKRTGTAAASMPDPTPHKEKTQRIARVLAIQEQVVAKLGGAMVGKTVRALVEGPGREEGTLTARLDNNMTVDFAGGAPVGEFADVRVTGVRGAMLKGELA